MRDRKGNMQDREKERESQETLNPRTPYEHSMLKNINTRISSHLTKRDRTSIRDGILQLRKWQQSAHLIQQQDP